MKVDITDVVWNEVMDICIDIEKGHIDHVDGTLEIQKVIEKYLNEEYSSN